MDFYLHKYPNCPVHEHEQLKANTFIVKVPNNQHLAFERALYCQITGKYINRNNELVTKKEAALEYINKRYKKNYKLSDIEVLTFKEYGKTLKANL